VLVGLLGSGVRDQFTVVGTNVNLANRLEGKAQNGQIIISPSTMNKTKGEGKFHIEAVQIEGEKIRAFEDISEYYNVEPR
jgi:class 3 adenylate cyclase